MNIILLGPPGAGKGTQAAAIVDEFHLTHVSTGDLFRMNLRDETPLGLKAKEYMDSGQLVPDDVTVAMLLDRIAKPDCKMGWMLDGFPRTISQAETLKQTGETIDAALAIDVDRNKLIERMTGRRVCRDCQAAYHVKNLPPKTEGVCDKCGGQLYQRDDDKAQTVAKRLDVYYEQTMPLLDYYSREGILKIVDGDRSVKDVANDVKAVLEPYR